MYSFNANDISEQERKHNRLWSDLQHDGILHQELVEHVWKRFSLAQQEELLQILEQFDLICLAPEDDRKQGGFGDKLQPVVTSKRRYYVPSMFKPPNPDQHTRKQDETKDRECIQFFIDFQGSFTGFVIFSFFLLLTNLPYFGKKESSDIRQNLSY